MKIKSILLNEAIELVDIVTNAKHLHTLLKSTKKMGNLPVLYRGFKGIKPGLNFITNDTTDYRGRNQPSQIVIDQLTQQFNTPVKQPVFTTFNKRNALDFGVPHFFIPTLPFTALQNAEVDDLLVDVNEKGIQHILPGYDTNIKPNKSEEILMFTKHYYLITIPWLKMKSYNKTIKTYADLNKSLHYLL